MTTNKMRKKIQTILTFLILTAFVLPNLVLAGASASSQPILSAGESSQEAHQSQDLSWGVLAFNPDKAVYRVGETAHFAFAVLDEKGEMVCDARVNLAIRHPNLGMETLSVQDGRIRVNPECRIKDKTLRPDYEAEYPFVFAGRYELMLTAITQKGSRSLTEYIQVVQDSLPFGVQRISATRLYPQKEYQMDIHLTANQNFQGTLEETLPASFVLTSRPENALNEVLAELRILAGSAIDKSSSPSPQIIASGQITTIAFPVNLQKGQSTTLSYVFDAPDISPQFYALGPARVKTASGQQIFAEPRAWQLANDAVNFKSGSFTKKTSTGIQNITGLGFQPKAIIFSWTNQTADNAFQTLGTMGMGFAAQNGSATSSRATAYCSDSTNAGGNSDSAVRQTTAAIVILDGAGNSAACSAALTGSAALQTFDADGFTLNWTVANASAYIIRYAAFGGSDITNAKAGQFTITNATGQMAVTDPGFSPDFVMFMSANSQTYDSNVTQGRFGLGWSTNATSTQGAIGFTAEHNQGAADTAMKQLTNRSMILHLTAGAPPAVDGEFEMLKMDPTGFTINKTDATSNPADVFYLALKGGQYKVGTATQPSSAQLQATSNVGFQPAGLIMMTDGLAASAANNNDAVLSFGAAGWATTTTFSATSSVGLIGYADDDGDGTPDPDYDTRSTKIIRGYAPVAGTSPTVSSEAHVNTFDSNGFTLNWTTANATLRQVLYFAIGHNSIVVSGNIYSDEGTTAYNCAANNLTVKAVINGGASLSATCAASAGSFTISPLFVNAGDVLTLYLDGETEKAVAVTRALNGSSPISDLHLYQNRVILRHEDSGPITISNLNQYDGDQDVDIQFTVATSPAISLTVLSGNELHIWSGKTFTPGGTIITNATGGDLHLSNATATIDTALSVIGRDIILDSGSTLKINGSVDVNGGDIATAGTALVTTTSGTPTVIISGAGNIGGGSNSLTFYNLTTTGSGTTTLTSAATITNDLTVGSGTKLTGANNLTVNGGNAAGNGTINLTGGTFLLDGAGSFGGTSDWTFYNLTFGDGTGAAITTAVSSSTITITSILTVAANQTLDAGGKQWKLTASGEPVIVNGSFAANISTVSYAAVSTTTAASLTYYDLQFMPSGGAAYFSFQSGEAEGWGTSYDTAGDRIWDFAHDSASNALFAAGSAGAATTAVIYRCLLSTNCNSASDWNTSFSNATDTQVYALAKDAVNGVLYAGTDGRGIIYRCAAATLCDAASDWSVATDTVETGIFSLVVDSTNNVIYAGSAGGAVIYRCALSTGCQNNGDWIQSFDEPTESLIYSLTFDSANNVLYAGTGNAGIIYRCATATLCDAQGDWAVSFDTLETIIYSLTFDSANNVLYAGTGNAGIIYRCATATLCDIAADWTVSIDTSSAYITSIVYDAADAAVFAGSGDVDGLVYRCAVSTLCDAASDWTVSADTPESYVLALLPAGGDLYAGSFSGGLIYKLNRGAAAAPNVRVDNNLTLGGAGSGSLDLNINDPVLDINGSLTIGSGQTLLASNSATATIASNFTNNGTFTHNNGTVQFDTAGVSTITSAASMSFYGFAVTAPGKTIQFQNHILTIPAFEFAGPFVITGDNGNRVNIQSDTGGSQWLAKFDNVLSAVSFVNIKDSGCALLSLPIVLSNGADSGNNGVCWVFNIISSAGGSGAVEIGSGSGIPLSGGVAGVFDGPVEGISGGGPAQGGGSAGGGGGAAAP